MNHTKSQQSVFIPPPPALPQFALDMDDEEDDEDVIATTERAPFDPVRAGRFARSSKPVLADGTSEVAVEDILLEAYVEVPPPPKTKRILTPPPTPAEGAALDAFLRAMPAPYVPYQAPRYDDSPSVAPVVMPEVYYPPPPPPPSMMMAAPPKSRAGLFVGLGLGLLALSAAAAGGITLGLKKHQEAVVASVQSEVVAPPPSSHEPHSVPVTAPAPAPAPPPSMSVDALPKPAIGEKMSLVTFPASAQGHRVFFDGTPMAVTAEPLLLRCGRHNVRIGSAGKVKVRDLACGQEVTLTR